MPKKDKSKEAAASNSQQIQEDAKTDFAGQIDASEGRVDAENAGSGQHSDEGGIGHYASPYFGQTGGDYGDIEGNPWTRGSGDEGRSSNINDIRGKWGGLGGPGEGASSADDQRNTLTGGYASLLSNTARLKDPGRIRSGEQEDTLRQYQTYRDTGGLSKENVDRMRGMGGFDEFSKTGGYTPESIANIKAQALSPIGSYAGGTKDELARRAAVQGGYTPGFDNASRQLQRDTARNIAATSLNANVGIQDRINQGRQWGISNVAASESGLAGLQSANKMNALQGEAGIGANLSNISAQDIANSQNTDQFNIQNAQDMKLAGLGGLSGLYEGSMGRQENAYGRELAVQQNALNRGLTSSENAYNRYHTTDENAVDRDFTAGQNALNREFAGDQSALGRLQQEYDRQGNLLNSSYNARNNAANTQAQLAASNKGIDWLSMLGTGAGIASNYFNNRNNNQTTAPNYGNSPGAYRPGIGYSDYAGGGFGGNSGATTSNPSYPDYSGGGFGDAGGYPGGPSNNPSNSSGMSESDYANMLNNYYPGGVNNSGSYPGGGGYPGMGNNTLVPNNPSYPLYPSGPNYSNPGNNVTVGSDYWALRNGNGGGYPGMGTPDYAHYGGW